jgi:hypothetical protein
MSRLSRGKAQLKSILSTSFYGDGGMQRMWDSRPAANGSNEAPKAVNLAGSDQDAVGDVGSRQITSSRQEPVVEGTALQS